MTKTQQQPPELYNEDGSDASSPEDKDWDTVIHLALSAAKTDEDYDAINRVLKRQMNEILGFDFFNA